MSSTQSNAQPTDSLELVNYGAGHAWLRPDRECATLDAAIAEAERLGQDMTARLGWPESHPALVEAMDDLIDDATRDTRYALTDKARRALAMDALFGHGWPTVAEAGA
jgi:hypothetical protein